MNKCCKLGMPILALMLATCSSEYVQYCGQTIYRGYVVGGRCRVFVLSSISPVDTVATNNLPDSLYHFLTTTRSGLYTNDGEEFLFSKEYQNNFPITFTYEATPDDFGDGCLRPDAGRKKNHFDRAVTHHVQIKCIKTGF